VTDVSLSHAPGSARFGPRSSRIHLVAWDEPGEGPRRFDPRSRYAERFWVPVLGPTATWVLRRFADALDAEPEGCLVDLSNVAAGLGLHWSGSQHSPLRRAVARCIHHKTARWSDDGTLAVLRDLPFVARRLLLRLPLPLQAEHRDWVAGLVAADDGATERRRARLIALDLADLGVEDTCIERHLLRRGVHPTTAFEAARWARSPEVDRLLSG
jgi:hypothetical protein